MNLLTQDSIDFFRELELNNNREWFNANKKRYEASVKKPMEVLAEQLIQRMKQLDPEISMLPKDALFRIHRDTRFSKDKTPYKDHAGMLITSKGKQEFSTPGLYVHLGTRSFGVASGCYHLSTEQLKHMRSHLVANAGELQTLLSEESFRKKFGEIKGEKNKVLPPEFKEAAKELPLLFNKQFYYWAEHEAEEALREDLVDFIMEHMVVCKPLNDFLVKGLG